MRGWIGDERGRMAVCLALSLLVVLGAGTIEIGRVINQANAVLKGLRVAALYAARNEFPLSPAVLTRV